MPTELKSILKDTQLNVLSLVGCVCRLAQRLFLSLQMVALAYLAAMHGSGSKTRAVACLNEFAEMV